MPIIRYKINHQSKKGKNQIFFSSNSTKVDKIFRHTSYPQTNPILQPNRLKQLLAAVKRSFLSFFHLLLAA